MRIPLLGCVASFLFATGAIAQTPAVSPAVSPAQSASAASAAPTATAPAATAAPVNDLADKIQQRIEKKFKKGAHIRVETDSDAAADRHEESGDIPPQVIPIVAISVLAVFGAPVLIVAVILYFGFSKNRMMHRTVRMMVEKGQEVPAALLNPPPAQRQRSDMRRGVVLVMIGLGLMLFLAAVNDWEGGAWSIGIIPFLIGAGYLLVWKLEGRKDNPPPVS